ncbi:hypothetical protein [Raineya sp.]
MKEKAYVKVQERKGNGLDAPTFERDAYKYKLSLYIDIPDHLICDYIYDNMDTFKKVLLDKYTPEELYQQHFWDNDQAVDFFRTIFFAHGAEGCPYQLIEEIKARAAKFLANYGIKPNELL